MPKVTCINHDGTKIEFIADSGQSLMSAAMDNLVDGIVAECGGSCSCSTCHVFVDSTWIDKVGAPGAIEKELLEGKDDKAANSRLSCQIEMTDELDGLVVRLPESQF